MPEDPWPRVKELFQAALDRKPEARAAFLAEACGGDALPAPRGRVAPRFPRRGCGVSRRSAPLARAAWEGRRVGAYRVLAEMGRGGMGTVYRAVRADDAFHKQVALKLVRGGRAHRARQRRFRGERQILARLDHPNIARLLDGGATAEGRPYLVMEYVVGEPDRRLLRRRGRSPTRGRIASSARSAPPSSTPTRTSSSTATSSPANILVTEDGVPKLLDFGIAKLLAADVDRRRPTADRFPAADARLREPRAGARPSP